MSKCGYQRLDRAMNEPLLPSDRRDDARVAAAVERLKRGVVHETTA